MSVKVNIKWGKELYKDVEVNLNGTAADFRQQLFSLTSVAPENQKVMGKGATLKDTEWDKFKNALVAGSTLMMMGTPSKVIQEVVTAPTTVFVEDLPEEEQQLVDLAPGLQNLGNTCYMNASLQMMNAMPELQTSLDLFKPPVGAVANVDAETKVTIAMKDVVRQLRNTKATVTPLIFLAMLRQSFPRFAEQVGGKFVQQSADECWIQLVQCFKRLPKISATPGVTGSNGIEQLLAGEMMHETKCVDAPEEAPKVELEAFETLRCPIDKDVDFLFQGLKKALVSDLTKISPTLNTSATYKTTSQITRLPYYLTIHFLRFLWKGKEGVRAKVGRPVEFPLELDTYEYCSDELKAKLSEKRELVRIRNDKPAAERQAIPQAELQNETGFYELAAVITHQGRDAEGGHYVAWVRQEGDNWLLFDDDKVSPATPEDIKKLSGKGGIDWHMAYLCLYRTKQYN